MKFREYGDLLSIGLQNSDLTVLCSLVNDFGITHEIIDLQYSSHFDKTENNNIFSVFILYKAQICKVNKN